VDKTYPTKVKKWKSYLREKERAREEEREREYKLNHPIDKYGNNYGIVTSPYTGKIWL
jgi:hypothetical protein